MNLPDPSAPLDPVPPAAGQASASVADQLARRPRWQRALWLAAGALALATGVVGVFLPLLPTTPFVLLAALCFARGSARAEAWLLNHRRFGPMVQGWRLRRAIPLRVKRLAWGMMAAGSAFAAWSLPSPWAYAPAVLCAGVAVWMARLPSA